MSDYSLLSPQDIELAHLLGSPIDIFVRLVEINGQIIAVVSGISVDTLARNAPLQSQVNGMIARLIAENKIEKGGS